MIPPPRPLTREEFRRRWMKLHAEGKPITLASIDPDFAEWHRRVHIPWWMWAGVLVAAFMLFAVMAIIILGGRV